MRIIHGDGYSEKEREDFKASVNQNIILALKTISLVQHLELNELSNDISQMFLLITIFRQ